MLNQFYIEAVLHQHTLRHRTGRHNKAFSCHGTKVGKIPKKPVLCPLRSTVLSTTAVDGRTGGRGCPGCTHEQSETGKTARASAVRGCAHGCLPALPPPSAAGRGRSGGEDGAG